MQYSVLKSVTVLAALIAVGQGGVAPARAAGIVNDPLTSLASVAQMLAPATVMTDSMVASSLAPQPAPPGGVLGPPTMQVDQQAPTSVTVGLGLTGPLDILAAQRSADESMHLATVSDVFNVARLGSFKIPLRSDPAERANILLASRAVDGVALMPGDLFSFNEVVGERTAERGYKDGWMFDNGKLIRGSGGGICLVATGLYNAALDAGLEIDERHPHSGIVRYANPGCDAAVVYGQEDLQFVNTTTAPLWIRTDVQHDGVVVSLFGAPQPAGYEVVVHPVQYDDLPPTEIRLLDPMLEPGQVVVDQKPRAGYAVTVERVFLLNGRVLRSEVVASDVHKPIDKIVRVAPAATADDGIDTFLQSELGA